MGVKRADKRRMDEMKVEFGGEIDEEYMTGWNEWEMKKLANRADAQTVEGKWRRGRSKLGCVIA